MATSYTHSIMQHKEEQLNIIRSTVPNPGHILITDASIRTGILIRYKHYLNDVDSWHKFMVKNVGGATRDEVLTAILEHVLPLDLIPVSYWEEDDFVNFLGRNCGPAIEKLCKDNLTVANPKSPTPFRLTIMLKFATTAEFKIDVQRNVKVVLTKRYNDSSLTLDLTKLHEDLDLVEFTPLFQPKILYFVLRISKQLAGRVESYILKGNRIRVLNPMHFLAASNYNIKRIDLSDNLIYDMSSLEHMKDIKLQTLILDGNPMCNKYTPEEYWYGVTKIFKTLKYLDGYFVQLFGFPAFKKHYFCDLEAAYPINQFLEYYFFLYDLQDRSLLKMAYHKDALFSLTVAYHNDQITSTAVSNRLPKYQAISRNLWKLANVNVANKSLIRGNEDIANVLKNLPLTEHDRSSFSVDLTSYTGSSAVLAVSGIFKESPENLLDSERIVFGFRRMFILSINTDGRCVITNELMHVYNALSWQVVNSFKHHQPVVRTIEFPKSAADIKDAIDAFKSVTTLEDEWARRCLEDRQYNMKMALTLFVDLYKQNQIPEEGFRKPNVIIEHENKNHKNKKMKV